MAVITHATMEADLRLAVALDQALMVLLQDLGTIRNVPGAIIYAGSVNASGSDTSRIRQVGLAGRDHFVATAAEDTDVADTSLADASVDVAVARQSLVRQISDVAVGTGFAIDVDPERLAEDMVQSFERRFNDMIATEIATAATSVGTSGADMVTDDFYDAKYQLQLNSNPLGFFAMLHPRQIADLEESIRGEGGAAQFVAATAAMLQAKGPGIQGEWLGIPIFASSDITSAGGDRKGAMWAPGALVYKDMKPDPRMFLGTSAAVVTQDPIIVEIGHILGGGRSKIAGDGYVGVKLTEQARIVGIFTDA